MKITTPRSAPASLKSLQTLKKELNDEIILARQQLKEKTDLLNNLQSKLNQIDKQISNLSVQDLVVSEHAMLRYFERILKFDLKEVQFKILTDDIKQQADVLGAGKFPHPDGFQVVIRGRVVTTIED